MTEKAFDVAVVGGGIGGLCLAQGLKKAGINVAVYERDRTRVDRLQGYRVHISPRGTSALHNCLPPELYKAFNPWDRICEPSSLRALFASAGIAGVDVQAQSDRHEIGSPDAWWAAVLGSGYRGTIDQLDADALQRVKDANLDFIRSSGVREVEANVVYAVAEKGRA